MSGPDLSTAALLWLRNQYDLHATINKTSKLAVLAAVDDFLNQQATASLPSSEARRLWRERIEPFRPRNTR